MNRWFQFLNKNKTTSQMIKRKIMVLVIISKNNKGRAFKILLALPLTLNNRPNFKFKKTLAMTIINNKFHSK